jgi:hypothetical protein
MLAASRCGGSSVFRTRMILTIEDPHACVKKELMQRHTLLVLSLLLVGFSHAAAEDSYSTVQWPSAEKVILQFRVGQPHSTGVIAGGAQRNYSADVHVKNLWDKKMSGLFEMQIFDGKDVMIGQAPLPLELLPNQEAAIPSYFTTVGVPARLALVPVHLPIQLRAYLPGRTVALTVRSVPDGALLAVDNKDAGSTPAVIEVSPGAHKLVLTKEGFNTYTHALIVQPDEASGGSVEFELSAAGDIVELRDGTLLVGDVVGMDFKKVTMRVDGKERTLERNAVKRVSLVERATK